MEERCFTASVKIKGIQCDEEKTKYPIAIKVVRPLKIGDNVTSILKLPTKLGEYDTTIIKSLIPGTKCLVHFNENYVISKIDDLDLVSSSSSSSSVPFYPNEKLSNLSSRPGSRNNRVTKLTLTLSYEDGSAYQKIIALNSENSVILAEALNLLIPNQTSFDTDMILSLG